MTVLKLCGVAVIAVTATVLIRSVKKDYAVFVGAAAAVVILGAAVATVSPVVTYISRISENTGFDLYVSTILKALGITVISGITSDVCRDCGENAVASKIEFASKCLILLLSLPVMEGIIAMSKEILFLK